MSDYPIKSPRKLIEVAIPLAAINEASSAEKSNPFLRNHPRSIHTWWSRKPLTSSRAILFAQFVNDPGYSTGAGFKYGKNKKEAAWERKRLFKIIEDLVKWENNTNEEVLENARVEIRRSWRELCELNKNHPQAAEIFNPDKLPALHDPFAGGGTIPLEAQRLGLEAYGSDLNPLAVLINKAMIEIPPKFAGCPPVNPDWKRTSSQEKALMQWRGAEGLAEDVRYYGTWILEEAQKRIGHLYPAVEITPELTKGRPDLKPLVGQKLTVTANIWARTVKSPNPAFSHVDVPLTSTYILSTKEGKEAYISPAVEGEHYKFTVKYGPLPATAKSGTKLARGANFACILSGAIIEPDYIKREGIAKRIGAKLMAVVANGPSGRVYLSADPKMEAVAFSAVPKWEPEGELPNDARAFTPILYGITRWRDLFTRRQLVALTTLADLVTEVREKILTDPSTWGSDKCHGETEILERRSYAEAVSIYLACATSRWSDFSNTICSWNAINQNIRVLFTRQAIQMAWEFAELSPFSAVGPWFSCVEANVEALRSLLPSAKGYADQADAAVQTISNGKAISTDPPYYDNIAYSDLADFFYVWLRKMLRPVYPQLFATMTTPKEEELIVADYRHPTAEAGATFFLKGMTKAIKELARQAHPAIPIAIYYAFKESETEDAGTTSTGWETFLEAVSKAGLQVVGTWPVRTEKKGRARDNSSNALASSIILVCRKRLADAPSISRREFIRELNGVLPEALDEMTKGSGDERSPVAPVDLSQAIIGPGMAVFSKYAAVLEADGSPMSVRTALQLINRFLAEDDFDADTQFCLHWFEQHGWTEGAFGDADTLSRGKGTSVDGMKEAGVLQSGSGKVRLLKWAEYATDWDPQTDTRTPVWEALHQLIRALREGGESASGALLALVGGKAEAVRQLAYRLYTLCERLGQAEDARAYNELITSWTGIESAANSVPKPADRQGTLFES